MVEGLPGVDLIGKIATDHISNQLDMTTVTTESGSLAKWVGWLAALVGPV